MTADGKAYNDVGEDFIRRFEKQNNLDMTEDEEAEMMSIARKLAHGAALGAAHPMSTMSRGMALAKPTPLWADLVNGAMILTDEGIAELRGRRAELEPDRAEVSRVVRTGEGAYTQTTYKTAREEISEAKQMLLKEWQRATESDGLPPQEVMDEIDDKAQQIIGRDASDLNKGQIKSQLQGIGVLYDSITKKFINRPGAGGAGGAGGASGSTAYLSAGPVIATNVDRSNTAALSDKTAEGNPMIKDNAVTRTLTENVLYDADNTGFTPEVWNKSAYPHLGTFRKQMVKSTGKQEKNDAYGITKGYGMSDAHADIIISSMKHNQKESGMTNTGGSNIIDQVNGAIDNYSDTYVDPHRRAVDSILKWDKWIAAWRAGNPLAQNMRRTGREYEELISTEVIDAKVKTKDGKKITMKELMAKPAREWQWHTIEWPMARELWREGPTPNAPTEGNVHDPKRKRFYHETSLDPDEYDLGALRSTLEDLIKEAAVLKELGQYIR